MVWYEIGYGEAGDGQGEKKTEMNEENEKIMKGGGAGEGWERRGRGGGVRKVECMYRVVISLG